MSFAATGLTIGKNGSVIAFYNLFYETEGRLLINMLLSIIFVKYSIISKIFVIVFVFRIINSDFVTLFVNTDDRVVLAFFFRF